MNITPRKISYIRRHLELTQQRLSLFVGVSENTVARWERGELIPRRKKPIKKLHEMYLMAKLRKGIK